MSRLISRVFVLVVAAALAMPGIAFGKEPPMPQAGHARTAPMMTATDCTAPSNDAFDRAVDLGSAGTGSDSITTVCATGETGEPNHHPDYNGDTYNPGRGDLLGTSVWYTWTAPDATPVTFEVADPTESKYPALGIYTGTELVSLAEIAYNQEAPIDVNWAISRVAFTPTASQVYYIGVGSWDQSAFTLSWRPTARPATDDFAAATALVDGTTGSTVDATYETGEPLFYWGNWTSDLSGRSVWYTYTSPSIDRTVFLSLEDSTYDTVLGVYTGSALGSLEQVTLNDDCTGVQSCLTFTAAADTTYHIGIGGYGGYWVDNGQVVNWGGAGTYYVTLSTAPVGAPGQPNRPGVDPGIGQVDASWYPPSAGDSAILAYTLAYREHGTSAWSFVTPDPDPTATTLTVSGLTDGTTYDFRVRATNDTGDGVWSIWTEATPGRVPAAPTITSAVPGDAQVELSWSESDPGTSPVLYYYACSALSISSYAWMCGSVGAATSVTIDELTNGASYDFRVQAINATGESDYSTVVSATPGRAPLAPEAPTLTPGDQHVMVSWSSPLSGGYSITSYTLAYKLDDAEDVEANWTTVTPSPDPTDTSLTVTDLTNGSLYDFKVLATNSQGDGPYSEVATATPNPVLYVAPDNKNVLAGASAPEYTFVLYTDGAHTTPFTGTVVTAPSCGSIYDGTQSAGTQLQITCGGGSNSGTAGSDPNYAFDYGTAAWLRVIAAASAPTNVVATVQTSGHGKTMIKTVDLTWTAPTDIGGSTITDYSVTLYTFTRGNKRNPGGYTQVGTFTTGSSSVFCTLSSTQLSASGTYAFKVAAVNGAGTGATSDYSNRIKY